MWPSEILHLKLGTQRTRSQAETDRFHFYRHFTTAVAPDHQVAAHRVDTNEHDIPDITIAADTLHPFLVELFIDTGFRRINIGTEFETGLLADLPRYLFIE